MTPSSAPSTPPPPAPEKRRPARTSTNGIHAFLVLIFRLLLLGVGGSVAALVGMTIAQFYPDRQTQEPPLVEKVRQGTQSLVDQVKQLPQSWNAKPSAIAPATSSPVPATSPSASPSAQASPPLTDSERQQLQAELTQLQAELQTLTQKSSQPLADRVQAIQQRIQAIQQRLSSFVAASPGASAVPPAATSTLSQGNQLMVTLPSDALFDTDQKSLRPGTDAILNAIVTDLQRYPKATIQVGAHTDNQGSAESDRLHSYEQATTIKHYLASKLGDYRWITVGYGHSRPLADNSSPINRQRNRRIEIVIDPHR